MGATSCSATQPGRRQAEDESRLDSEGDYHALGADVEQPSSRHKQQQVNLSEEGGLAVAIVGGGAEKKWEEEDSEKDWETKEKKGLLSTWFVVPLLLCAVVAISSAAPVMKSMQAAAPMTRAGWRLQTTTMLLLPGFIWQCCRMQTSGRQRLYEKTTLSVLFISAVSLAVNFGLWVWSLANTSVPHSLLLVSMAPVVLSVMKIIQCQVLSKGEASGVGLGVIGLLFVASAAQVEGDSEVTLIGDAVAFIASVPLAFHLLAGHYVRGWMPLFIYTFPVTGVAAIIVTIAGVALEGWGYTEAGLISGPFNWVLPEFLWPTIYLAVGPGLVGQTGLNAVLAYTSSLVVAVAITMEPVFATAISWAQGQTQAPGLRTCVGGALLLVGTILVIYASEKEESQEVKQCAVEDFRQE